MEKDGLNYPSAYSKIQKIKYTDSNGEEYNGSVTQNSKSLDVRNDKVIEYPFEGWAIPQNILH
jgi:hypothetical protein